jgi:hypothetical protein
MILVKANAESEADVLPSSAELAEMGRYNEELIDAGVMLAGEGLKSSRHGARVRYSKDGIKITDGPFPETKELLAGFWIIQAASKQEALNWMRKAPFRNGEELELREVFETEDFPVDDISRETLEKEKAWREELAEKAKR